ncbi:Dimethyladenosine transferase [Heterostelium album PN500]|uniref:rRNA adenine N(6)-methyltransferase n=1 Tax=Heterostelium pallidum (strain ATCC 26659 / Pp 5 / PN500) TaxID=670386 RepID=D3BVF6_HETP5|nr:Dimethyladenosine transferase [Heterostelium album PN500]EFA74579.1 Dimethyladenosine transferase [Heterostelium album PN500]|eukprot:XP_020426713.1 Dimethyladenosine transferase [Heterostelium album PN500]
MSIKLPNMPKIQDLIRLYGLSAKQQLSQNFLLDLNITDKICRVAGGFNDCTVIEVGAGPGGLTRSLLNSGAKKVIAVEMDRRFIPALKMLEDASDGRLSVVMGDMKDVNEAEILKQFGAVPTDWDKPSKVKIIGNLPFNVGTHLMLKWIRQIKPREGLFEFGRVPMILMFQKELADRIIAPVSSHEYGRLAVMIQQECDSKVVYDLPGKVFVPPPKVDASVVYIEPKVKPIGDLKSKEYLEYVCRELFTQKRKTLGNAIKCLGNGAESLIEGIDPTKRPQNLTVEELVKISNRFNDWPHKKDIDMLSFRNDARWLRGEEKKLKKEQRVMESLEKRKEKLAKFKNLDKKQQIEYLKVLRETIPSGLNLKKDTDDDNNANEYQVVHTEDIEDGDDFDFDEFEEDEDTIIKDK